MSGRIASLRQVRESIDRIDRRLVGLLAARGRLVREAARFKRAVRDVRAPARAARVLANVRRLARRHGVDPRIAARVWRAMLGAFIRFELAEHSRLRARRRRRAGRGGSR